MKTRRVTQIFFNSLSKTLTNRDTLTKHSKSRAREPTLGEPKLASRRLFLFVSIKDEHSLTRSCGASFHHARQHSTGRRRAELHRATATLHIPHKHLPAGIADQEATVVSGRYPCHRIQCEEGIRCISFLGSLPGVSVVFAFE